MAQSAVIERALLGIESFWEKPTLEPPLRWDRWQIMLKLAILAKEGISIDNLRQDSPDKVTLPPESIYEDNVENSTSQSKRDWKTRIEQLRNAWLNRCQKIELVDILCGDKLWKYCCLSDLSQPRDGGSTNIYFPGTQYKIDRVTT